MSKSIRELGKIEVALANRILVSEVSEHARELDMFVAGANCEAVMAMKGTVTRVIKILDDIDTDIPLEVWEAQTELEIALAAFDKARGVK